MGPRLGKCHDLRSGVAEARATNDGVSHIGDPMSGGRRMAGLGMVSLGSDLFDVAAQSPLVECSHAKSAQVKGGLGLIDGVGKGLADLG